MEKLNNVSTEYGMVAIITESGKKKIDFSSSKFNSMMDLLGFLNNKTLTHQLTGY